MGAKITIDSATLANKGLEVIEAHWLYDVAYDAIDVVIHPQSVVHSAVLFVDGSLKAQLGTPDMRLPIQYALTYPERLPSPATPPDLVAAARLDFRAPDEARFPALRIAREAGRIGPRASAALIAADEVAVARFLDGTLDFPGIPRLLEAAVRRFGEGPDQAPDVPALVALDREVRAAFATGPWEVPHDGDLRHPRHRSSLFILVLGGLVLVHELGHFVTARIARVRVLEFGIGFPPRARILGRGGVSAADTARVSPRAGRGPRGHAGRRGCPRGGPRDLGGSAGHRLHAQLAADRRLRQARGRGRRRRATTRARSGAPGCRSSWSSWSPASS